MKVINSSLFIIPAAARQDHLLMHVDAIRFFKTQMLMQTDVYDYLSVYRSVAISGWAGD